MRRVLLALGAVVGAFVFWLFAVWPPPSWYRTHWPARTAFMTMRASEHDSVRLRYRPVPLDSIAPVMQEAVMTGEDSRFLLHGGIDYLAMLQALGYRRPTFAWTSPRDREELRTVLSKAWERRDRIRGASTITQQLAKNLYLSASRNPLRKVKEAVIAWRLEWALGKPRIMELYLNVVELGDGIWGVEAASERYFGHGAARLTREQAASLAGSLPFPLRSNPGYRPGRMRWRQNLILRRMRGEPVEVPPEPEEENEVPPEAGEAPPEADPVPADTANPAPLDSLPAEESAEPAPPAVDTITP